ncbi:unnamed protein product, partial [Prorocentrum cordatum]
MDPASYEAVADTLSQSARDRIQHQRGLLSGDPQLVSRAAEKESDVLTDRLGKVQKKYDKAQENLHRAVRCAAEVGAELEELQQQQKEAAARGAAALAQVGGTAAAAPGTPPGQCDGLLQQARLLGDAELETKLTAVAAQLATAQQELQAKAAQAQHPPPVAPAGTAPSGGAQPGAASAGLPSGCGLAAAGAAGAGQAAPPPAAPVGGADPDERARAWAARNEQKLLEACASAVGDEDDMDLDEGAKRAIKQRAIELFGQALKKLRTTHYVPPQQSGDWYDCDLALVQEHKVPQRQRDAQEQALRKTGWKAAINPAVRAGAADGASDSLAGLSGTLIATPVRYGFSQLEGLPHCACPARASLLHLSHGPKGGLLVGTMYLHDSEDLSERNWHILCAMGQAVKSAGLPFILSADWQVTPEELTESGWVAGIGGVVVAPKVGTVRPSERVIDYFVMSPFLAAGAQLTVLEHIAVSPHRAVQ